MQKIETKINSCDKKSFVQVKNISIQIMIRNMIERIANSVIEKDKKDFYIRQLSNIDIETLEQGCLSSEKKISGMDIKYIICFSIEMNVKDISLLFNIDPASVRTARYRIRKKFGKQNTFCFLF